MTFRELYISGNTNVSRGINSRVSRQIRKETSTFTKLVNKNLPKIYIEQFFYYIERQFSTRDISKIVEYDLGELYLTFAVFLLSIGENNIQIQKKIENILEKKQ